MKNEMKLVKTFAKKVGENAEEFWEHYLSDNANAGPLHIAYTGILVPLRELLGQQHGANILKMAEHCLAVGNPRKVSHAPPSSTIKTSETQ